MSLSSQQCCIHLTNKCTLAVSKLRSFGTFDMSRVQAGFGTQVEAEGDVATAFTLARILSNIPLSRGGPTSVVIFDIHALQVSSAH